MQILRARTNPSQPFHLEQKRASLYKLIKRTNNGNYDSNANTCQLHQE